MEFHDAVFIGACVRACMHGGVEEEEELDEPVGVANKKLLMGCFLN